jgi:hypothetical protein
MQVCQRAGDRGREAVGQSMQRHQRLVMQARPRIRVASLSVPSQVSVRCLYPSSPVSESYSPLKTGQSAGHHVPSPLARHHVPSPLARHHVPSPLARHHVLLHVHSQFAVYAGRL